MTIKKFSKRFDLEQKEDIERLKLLLDMEKDGLLDDDLELSALKRKVGYFYHIDEIVEHEKYLEVVWHVDQSIKN